MNKVILLSYFGAKNRLAPKYPPPVYDTIVEPFAGSAGYSCLYPWKKVILFEKDFHVFQAVNYLIQAEPEEVLALPLLEPGQRLAEVGDLTDGARAFISFWLNKGTARGATKLSKWAVEYPKNSFYWGERCRERAAYAASKIKHWTIHPWGYRAADDIGEATWFIDPPYEGTGHNYVESYVDYAALGAWCRSRRGQVIVCENEGATWLPFQPLCGTSGAARGKDKSTRKRSAEAVWVRPGVDPVA